MANGSCKPYQAEIDPIKKAQRKIAVAFVAFCLLFGLGFVTVKSRIDSDTAALKIEATQALSSWGIGKATVVTASEATPLLGMYTELEGQFRTNEVNKSPCELVESKSLVEFRNHEEGCFANIGERSISITSQQDNHYDYTVVGSL